MGTPLPYPIPPRHILKRLVGGFEVKALAFVMIYCFVFSASDGVAATFRPNVPNGYVPLPQNIKCAVQMNANINGAADLLFEDNQTLVVQARGLSGKVLKMRCSIGENEKDIQLESGIIENDMVKTKDFGNVILMVVIIKQTGANDESLTVFAVQPRMIESLRTYINSGFTVTHPPGPEQDGMPAP